MNILKGSIETALKEKMKAAALQRKRQAGIINRSQTICALEKFLIRSLLQENPEAKPESFLTKTAETIRTNLHYNKRFKQRDVEENFGPEAITLEAEKDPRIKYMKKCLEKLDRVLPVFDKVVKKTLCLHNYYLNGGHIEGIADACEFLDPNQVNRLLFNNCGMSGDDLAKILEGATKMRDLKSLIYKQGAINQLSIDRLLPLFVKSAPYQLEEL